MKKIYRYILGISLVIWVLTWIFFSIPFLITQSNSEVVGDILRSNGVLILILSIIIFIIAETIYVVHKKPLSLINPSWTEMDFKVFCVDNFYIFLLSFIVPTFILLYSVTAYLGIKEFKINFINFLSGLGDFLSKTITSPIVMIIVIVAGVFLIKWVIYKLFVEGKNE